MCIGVVYMGTSDSFPVPFRARVCSFPRALPRTPPSGLDKKVDIKINTYEMYTAKYKYEVPVARGGFLISHALGLTAPPACSTKAVFCSTKAVFGRTYYLLRVLVATL